MSQFAIRFECDIVDVKTGQGGKTTIAITVQATDRRHAEEIAERNLQAAMLEAQRRLSRCPYVWKPGVLSPTGMRLAGRCVLSPGHDGEHEYPTEDLRVNALTPSAGEGRTDG